MAYHHPLNRIFHLLVLGLLLFSSEFTANAQEGVLEDTELDVLYQEGLYPAAREVVDIYPDLRTGLEKTIGWEVDFRPGVVLIGDNNQFKAMAGNNLTVAYALPDRNVIVIDYSRMKTTPFNLESIFKHELCHLLLHSKIASDRLPRWLDEGIAQWVSGGLADIVVEKRPVLTRAVLQNRIIRLKYLNEAFPDDEGMMVIAYAQSRDLVEYLVRREGVAGLLSILGALSEGEDIDSAAIKTFSVSLEGLENDWHAGLRKRATWMSLVINNLYEVLFFCAAVALVIGFYRAWRRKRQYGEEEEDGLRDDR